MNNDAIRFFLGLFFILFLCFLPLSLVFFGAYLAEKKTKQVFVMDRLNACEAKGGKYGLWYNENAEEYVESCEVLKTKIKDW